MIVNTAYIYMGSGGGGEPVNPNLWQDGVSNYPVVFIKGSSISADGLSLPKNNGAATFSELKLTGFNSLTLSINTRVFIDIPIKIEFLNSSDQLLGTETVTFKGSASVTPAPQTINIPSSAKIQNAKIRMTNTSKNISATLFSALLS